MDSSQLADDKSSDSAATSTTSNTTNTTSVPTRRKNTNKQQQCIDDYTSKLMVFRRRPNAQETSELQFLRNVYEGNLFIQCASDMFSVPEPTIPLDMSQVPAMTLEEQQNVLLLCKHDYVEKMEQTSSGDETVSRFLICKLCHHVKKSGSL